MKENSIPKELEVGSLVTTETKIGVMGGTGDRGEGPTYYDPMKVLQTEGQLILDSKKEIKE